MASNEASSPPPTAAQVRNPVPGAEPLAPPHPVLGTFMANLPEGIRMDIVFNLLEAEQAENTRLRATVNVLQANVNVLEPAVSALQPQVETMTQVRDNLREELQVYRRILNFLKETNHAIDRKPRHKQIEIITEHLALEVAMDYPLNQVEQTPETRYSNEIIGEVIRFFSASLPYSLSLEEIDFIMALDDEKVQAEYDYDVHAPEGLPEEYRVDTSNIR